MPVYPRIPGANISGITVIRLIPVVNGLNMDKVFSWYELYTDEIWSVFNDVPPFGIYTFATLNGTGTFNYNFSVTDAGVLYEYEVNWQYPKAQVAQNSFLKLIEQYNFIIALADGNGTFMVLGKITQPFEITPQYTADGPYYGFTAKAQCTVPPLYVEGITNAFLYYGEATIN